MRSKPPLIAVVLIVIGVFFLGKNLGWISGDGSVFKTWWPVISIVLGGFLLFKGRTPRA